jgi:hypothetical protein
VLVKVGCVSPLWVSVRSSSFFACSRFENGVCNTTRDSNMDQLSGWRVADKLEKRSLLIAVNCVAALSIFFFGYDQ